MKPWEVVSRLLFFFLEDRCHKFTPSLHEGDKRTVSLGKCHKHVNKVLGSTQIRIFNRCTFFFLQLTF